MALDPATPSSAGPASAPLGQGTAGLTDLVTALQGIIRQFSSSNQNWSQAIAAIQGLTPFSSGLVFYTVALAQAAIIDASVPSVIVDNFAAPGDGGGGLYARKGSAPSYSAKFQSADGAWWGLVNTGVVVPEQFGAVGTADDTAVLQNALDFLAATGRGILRLPRVGGYTTQGINVGTLCGIQGPGQLNQKSSMSNQQGFVVLNGDEAFIDGVDLVGQLGAPTGTGVMIGANNCRASHNVIVNFPFSGVATLSGLVSADYLDIHNNAIVGCNSNRIYLAPSAACSHVSIKDNYCAGGVNQGMSLTNCNFLIVSGNFVEDAGSGVNAGGAIWVFTSFGVQINSNWCNRCNGDMIELVSCTEFTIANNVAMNAAGPPGDDQNTGIVLAHDCAAGTITGNLCQGNSGMGIHVGYNCDTISITGNTCYGNSTVVPGNWAGIQVDPIGGANPTAVSIVGNISRGATQIGIKLNLCDNVLVANNDLRDTSPAMSNTGTSGIQILDNMGYNPVGPSVLVPGATTWRYTAGASPETLYLTADTSIVSLSYIGTNILGAATGANVPVTVSMRPNDYVDVAYVGVLSAATEVH